MVVNGCKESGNVWNIGSTSLTTTLSFNYLLSTLDPNQRQIIGNNIISILSIHPIFYYFFFLLNNLILVLYVWNRKNHFLFLYFIITIITESDKTNHLVVKIKDLLIFLSNTSPFRNELKRYTHSNKMIIYL